MDHKTVGRARKTLMRPAAPAPNETPAAAPTSEHQTLAVAESRLAAARQREQQHRSVGATLEAERAKAEREAQELRIQAKRREYQERLAERPAAIARKVAAINAVHEALQAVAVPLRDYVLADRALRENERRIREAGKAAGVPRRPSRRTCPRRRRRVCQSARTCLATVSTPSSAASSTCGKITTHRSRPYGGESAELKCRPHCARCRRPSLRPLPSRLPHEGTCGGSSCGRRKTGPSGARTPPTICPRYSTKPCRIRSPVARLRPTVRLPCASPMLHPTCCGGGQSSEHLPDGLSPGAQSDEPGAWRGIPIIREQHPAQGPRDVVLVSGNSAYCITDVIPKH